MDLGLFRRRRVVFWLWIVGPLLAAVVVHYSVFLYCGRMSAMLQERQALASILPGLQESLSASQAAIDTFPSVRATATDARAALTTRVSELSTKHGFVANSLRISSLTESGPVQKLEVTIEGEGRLLSIMKFVNDLQTPESLMSLVGASLRINAFFPIPVYNCELTFESGFAPTMRQPPQTGGQVGGVL